MFKINRRIFIILSVLTLLVLFSEIQAAYTPVKLAKVYPETIQKYLQLRRLNLDVATIRPDRSWEIVTNQEEIDRLRNSGFVVEILQEDLVGHYRQGLNTTLTMGGYHTYNETVAALDSIHNEHPGITTAKINIGTSLEGRTIWAMKISDNPDVDEAEPEVFYNALTHAREPIGIEVLLYFMRYLTNFYGADSQATDLVDNRELYFVPIVNPDGYVYNELTNPGGGGLWRKNRRNNGDGTFGVDLNRNFGYLWGLDDEGSSPFTSGETYRGTAPFSEPENQVLRDFVNSHDFVIGVNYHSYGNLFLYPWGFDYIYAPDNTTFKMISDVVTFYNGYLGEPGWGLYLTNGTADDWMYGERNTKHKIISFTPEVGDWFWPPQSSIGFLADENLQPNLYLAYIAGELYSRSLRFVKTEPDFIDTLVPEGETLLLNFRLVNQDSSSNLYYSITALSNYTPPSTQAYLTESLIQKRISEGAVNPANLISPEQIFSSSLVDWLSVEPAGSGTIVPDSFTDFTVKIDASQLSSGCYGNFYSGALLVTSYNDRVSSPQDTAIIPVTVFVGSSSTESFPVRTAKVKTQISNTANLGKQGSSGMRYLDDNSNYLYDGSLFLAYTAGSQKRVHRDLFSTHSLKPIEHLLIDSISSSRFQQAGFANTGELCDIGIIGEILSPLSPDSSEMMILRYKIFNKTASDINGLYVGLVADWDVPTSSGGNDAGTEPNLNLVWQKGRGTQTNRYSGLLYVSDSKANGGQVVSNAIHVYPNGDFLTNDLYDIVSTANFSVETQNTDLTSTLTGRRIDLGVNDTVQFDFALLTTKAGLDSLKSSAKKARVFLGLRPVFLRGDLTSDGKIGTGDLVYLINYLFRHGPDPVSIETGDVDCSGGISVADLIYLINHLFRFGPAPCP